MVPQTSIVFGASGDVGSATAHTAQQLGGRVILALRNPGKPIKGISYEDEASQGFQRLQADLTKPETIIAAVRSTGAKNAFIYLVHDAADHMRSAVDALKTSGIEFVVFLSSIGVQGDPGSIPASSGLPYRHAQVEMVLSEIFGVEGYVAIRPGYFNTNGARFWSKMLAHGEVRMAYPDAVWDWISPVDIGKVCGTVLTGGMQSVEGIARGNSIFLCGPKLISQKDAVDIFARAIGKNVRIVELDENAAIDALEKSGLPRPIAEVITKAVGQRYRGDSPSEDFYLNTYEEGALNLRKYVERPASLEEWTQINTDLFNC